MPTTRRSQTSQARPEPADERTATALKLFVVLSRAYAAVSRHTTQDIARHDLTGAEFGVLEVLYHRGPLLLGDIQRRILVSSGGITFLVDRLVKKGFVERRECEKDRRARYAALTPAGERLMRRIFPEHADCIAEAVAGLDPAAQKTAIRLLKALGQGAAERLGEGAVGMPIGDPDA